MGMGMAEWAHLKEIVVLIASKLFIEDIQSCRQVCRTWKVALAESPYLQLPYLMQLCHKPTSKWRFHQHTQRFDVSLPLLDKALIKSSNYGWLLMQQSRARRLFFFDPFNMRTIRIGKAPSFTAFHFFNPPTSQECFVVGIKSNTSQGTVKIGILRSGEPAWETHVYDSEFEVAPTPPVLRGGLLYFVDLEGNVATLDVHQIHTSWTFHTECPPSWIESYKIPFHFVSLITHHYLFQIKGDESLYAVFLVGDVEKVNVFRLSEPSMKWELVNDLGDNTVYLSPASCFGVTAHSPSMANTIFFPKFHNDDMLCYSMATRRYHSLRGDYSHDDDTHGLCKFNVGVAWMLPAPDTPADAGDADWPADSTQES